MQPMIEAILAHKPEPQSIISIEHPDGSVEVWNVSPGLATLVREVVLYGAGAPDIEKEGSK